MRFKELTDEDKELVKVAQQLIRKRESSRSSVAAALRTTDDRIFSGVNVEVHYSSPCSMCAEYSAVGSMVSAGGREIDSIVAVHYEKNKYDIIPPCGKCRQLINEFGNPYVILKAGKRLAKVRFSEIFTLP